MPKGLLNDRVHVARYGAVDVGTKNQFVLLDAMDDGTSRRCVVVFTFATWLWKTHEAAREAHLRLNMFETTVKKDVDDLKTKQRDLRDDHVRMDTQLGVVLSQLGKLDRIEKIDTRTEVTQAMSNGLISGSYRARRWKHA